MSDAPRTMNVREFVRGGYREGDTPVVVVNGNGVAGTWFPGTSAVEVKPINGEVHVAVESGPRFDPAARVEAVLPMYARRVRPAPKPGAKKR